MATIMRVGGGGSSAEPTGLTWKKVTTPVGDRWASVAFGNGAFVAIGGKYTSNNIVRSTNGGKSWSAVSGNTGYWFKVLYGNGTFLALQMGMSSIPSSEISTDGGATWTSKNGYFANQQPNCGVYADDRFVVLDGYSSSPKAYYTTDNGQTWSEGGALTFAADYAFYVNGSIHAFRYDNSGLHHAVSANKGVTWTETTLSISLTSVSGMSYGSGKFVIVGLASSQLSAVYSSDGATWSSAVTLPYHASGVTRIGFCDGAFVVFSHSGTVSAYSTDGGATWITGEKPDTDSGSLYESEIACGDGYAVCLGYGTGSTASTVSTSAFYAKVPNVTPSAHGVSF